MFAYRQFIAIGLACFGVFVLAVGVTRELQDDVARAGVEASVDATSEKSIYEQWGVGPRRCRNRRSPPLPRRTLLYWPIPK